VQPRCGNRIGPIAQSAIPWSTDNDALTGIQPDENLRMLDAIARVPRDQLMFVAAPDAVERRRRALPAQRARPP